MRTRRTIGVLLAAATVAVTPLATTPAQAGALAWDCSPGYSCYYDGGNGTNRIWVAPSGGKCFDLGQMGLNDRISSIYNRGNGTVHLYNWIGYEIGYWDYLESVPKGAMKSLTDNSNKVDRVCIDG
ncbi:peptidase inhibitor family I36 protein [Streptosporangium sp. NPDC004379]|uniref:peptidase inhibitor family I36 protein n=1 Tax=Streptosporangium sp. NPDC004379 TaxID=3366189 RepID=UPI0036C04AB5